MNGNSDTLVACPVAGNRNDSKTARMAAQYVIPDAGSRHIGTFGQLREVLRSGVVRQGGASVAPVEKDDPTRASLFFLEGEAHRHRRNVIFPFFTPKAIATRHMRGMKQTTEALLGEFRKNGRGKLDDMSSRLTAAVASELIGMTNSHPDRRARRIEKSNGAPMAYRGGISKLLAPLVSGFYALQVYYFDVLPAIAERRAQRKEDVISCLLDEGRSNKEILVECITFGLAGMGTTREFLVVAAWHLFEKEDLRKRFLDGDEGEQVSILMEILRLEPVANMIYRSTTEDLPLADGAPIPAGASLSLDIRSANLDETEVGACPMQLDPDRAKRLKVNPSYMSFGDGEHRCPGWQVALAETRVFLDQLLRIPGVRLVRAPDILWVPPMLQQYMMRNAIIACDRS